MFSTRHFRTFPGIMSTGYMDTEHSKGFQLTWIYQDRAAQYLLEACITTTHLPCHMKSFIYRELVLPLFTYHRVKNTPSFPCCNGIIL